MIFAFAFVGFALSQDCPVEMNIDESVTGEVMFSYLRSSDEAGLDVALFLGSDNTQPWISADNKTFGTFLVPREDCFQHSSFSVALRNATTHEQICNVTRSELPARRKSNHRVITWAEQLIYGDGLVPLPASDCLITPKAGFIDFMKLEIYPPAPFLPFPENYLTLDVLMDEIIPVELVWQKSEFFFDVSQMDCGKHFLNVRVLMDDFLLCVNTFELTIDSLSVSNQRPVRSQVEDVPPSYLAADDFHMHNTSVYSSFRCVGGNAMAAAGPNRVCEFSNMCLHTPTQEWIYYRDPNRRTRDYTHFDGNNVQTNFPMEIFATNSVFSNLNVPYKITTADKSVPSTAERYDRNVIIATQSDFARSIGHYILDFLFIIFLNARLLLNSSDDVQVLRFSRDFFDDEFAAENHRVLLPALSKFEIRDMGSDPQLSPVEDKIICFNRIIIGSSWYSRVTRGGPIWELEEMRRKILKFLDVDCMHPRRHRILVHDKSNTRAHSGGINEIDKFIQNLNSTVNENRRRGPVDVQKIDLSENVPLLNRIKLLRQATLLITPGGSTSILSMFLPRSATVIAMDTPRGPVAHLPREFSLDADGLPTSPKPISQSARGEEAKVLNSFRDIHALFFPILTSEVEPVNITHDFADMNFRKARININLERMMKLVDLGLSNFRFDAREVSCVEATPRKK